MPDNHTIPPDPNPSAPAVSKQVVLHNDSHMFYVVVSLMILGIGFGFFSSPNTNAVMSSVEKKFYGVASGVLGTKRLTGQMFSMGLTMLLFTLYIGGRKIAP